MFNEKNCLLILVFLHLTQIHLMTLLILTLCPSLATQTDPLSSPNYAISVNSYSQRMTFTPSSIQPPSPSFSPKTVTHNNSLKKKKIFPLEFGLTT